MSVPTRTSDITTLSSTGLEPKLAGLLAYLLGPLSGIFFLVVENPLLGFFNGLRPRWFPRKTLNVP